MIVYKYPLNPQLTMQFVGTNGTPLSVQVQGQKPVLYVLEEEDTMKAPPRRAVPILRLLTGDSEPTRKAKYLGTSMLEQGTFVLHWFQL